MSAISSCVGFHLPVVTATTVAVVAAVFGTSPVHADIMQILVMLVLCMYVCVCRALVSPVVKGAENLPDPLGPRRPLLFIGTPPFMSHFTLNVRGVEQLQYSSWPIP